MVREADHRAAVGTPFSEVTRVAQNSQKPSILLLRIQMAIRRPKCDRGRQIWAYKTSFSPVEVDFDMRFTGPNGQDDGSLPKLPQIKIGDVYWLQKIADCQTSNP